MSSAGTGIRPDGMRLKSASGFPLSAPKGVSPLSALTRFDPAPSPIVMIDKPRTFLVTNTSRLTPRQNAPCTRTGAVAPPTAASRIWMHRSKRFTGSLLLQGVRRRSVARGQMCGDFKGQGD